MEEFYLHLPSNTITNSATNTVNRYMTTFSDTLELGRNWEVGLTAISYTHSWYNVKPVCWLHLMTFNGDGRTTVPLDHLYHIPDVWAVDSLSKPIELGFLEIPERDDTAARFVNFHGRRQGLSVFYVIPGYYSTIQELVDHINQEVRKSYAEIPGFEKLVPRLEYVPQQGRIRSLSGRVVYKKDEGRKYILHTFICTTNTALAQMLGTPEVRTPTDMAGLMRVRDPIPLETAPDIHYGRFPEDLIETVEGSNDSIDNAYMSDAQYSYLFPRVFDMHAGIHALCVYCDMVDLTIVGDHRVNLLRTVPIPRDAKFMDQVDIEFQHVHYLPVTKTELRNVEVYIKDENGSDIPFETGRVILTLHFRKAQRPIQGLSNE